MTGQTKYIHGTDPEEQVRLALMNDQINAAALRELGLRGGEKILDMGCGLAQFSRAMARAAGPDGFVLGIEGDGHQIEQATAQAAAAGEAELMEMRKGDVLAPPLHDNEWHAFDIVHARFLLEHLPDPQRAVDVMVRAAKPGGRIVLQDDDHDIMRFWPAIPRLERVWHTYARVYERMGLDGYIGRKLAALLHTAGARPTRTTCLFYGACAGHTSFEHLTANLRGVLAGAAESIIEHSDLTRADIQQALDEFEAWRKLPHAAFWYGICWAEATAAP